MIAASTRARLVAITLPVCACIIPDRDIQVDPGIENLSAVRIVERPPRLPEMDELCNVDDLDDAELEYCPEVRGPDLPSGPIQPAGGSLCICPGGPGSDRRAIPNFIIYAEDGDRELDRPKDKVYGVALLDPDLFAERPEYAAAYPNYWEWGRSGEVVDVGNDIAGDRTAPPVGRRVLSLWRFPFGRTGVTGPAVDLCNDDNGEPLEAGLHNLRFMVTDRPFFRPVALGADDGVVKTDDGKIAYDPVQPGVPDLAAGATYAVIDWVFECIDASDPEVKAHDDAERELPLEQQDLICDCVDPEGA